MGRAKAGKSSFLNALLGADLAKVGVTETTATINFFRYGHPPDPTRPVRCPWQGGRYEDVTREFLDSLQGNDPAVLRRAAGLAYLEYLVPHEALREVTLVDTPGTEAAVDEHQQRTAEFLQLQRQLREQHASSFTPAELDESRALFGLYGSDWARRLRDQADPAVVGQRQQAWARRALSEREPIRRAVAQRAEQRYGQFLYALLSEEGVS